MKNLWLWLVMAMFLASFYLYPAKKAYDGKAGRECMEWASRKYKNDHAMDQLEPMVIACSRDIVVSDSCTRIFLAWLHGWDERMDIGSRPVSCAQ